jgi:threonine synthase
MTVAVSVSAGAGAEAVVCASTGNTSASAAAYASRAGLLPLVLLPAGRIATGKLAQAIVHGARVVQIEGNFDACLDLARKLAENYPVALVNSINPVRLEGQKTAAFEIVDELGDAPDLHVLPVGNGGNTPAYWRGYTQYRNAGIASRTPRIWAFQAAGAAPLVLGHRVEQPETVATAIRIGNPASARLAVVAKDESGGLFEAVTDDQILAAQRLLAEREGVFVEPASAAGVAGLLAKHERGEVESGQQIVITLTGNGLKDVDTALSSRTPLQSPVVGARLADVARACGFGG